tara:strand:- start:1499 stop:1810 length:312 start_codon:yes stop_codon:yes gene_type:complete
MQNSIREKKYLTTIGHNLKPVVIVSHKGLSDNIKGEIDRALNDHELIKIKIIAAQRGDRKQIIKQICKHHDADCVQSIGHMALIYRPSKNINPRLSNLSQSKP